MDDDKEFKEFLDIIFKAGEFLEDKLIQDGYTDEGATGTCSDMYSGHFTRWMEFNYIDIKHKNKPTQEYLDSITPEYFNFEIMEKDTYDISFCIGVSLR